MMDYRAKQPFRFFSCMELREILGKRARDEQRLLELIEEAPADSIYYHTHSYYLRHPYTQSLYPNDFATWVALHAQDRILGERLGVLDPFDFDDIEELRGEIMAIIADHLDHERAAASRTTDEPFEFVRSHVIEVDLGIEVMTLREFRDAVSRVEVGAVYNHLCEARMRKRQLWGDFAYWLSAEMGLGLPDLAAQVVQVGRLGLSLEGMRERIVTLCDQVLSAS
ncbi:MAG: hypothetical protein HY581_09975 [Nitrospirae bacterium]|nr:hypothetical protein [Nitrospirota bacterium]